MTDKNAPLPDSWKWTTIGEVADTTSGGTPLRKHPEYFIGNIPWVKSGELGDGIVSETEEKISEVGLKNSNAKIFPSNTVLVALYGATVGRVGLLNIDAATNQAVCALFPRQNSFTSKYMFYWLLSQRQELINKSMGGAQPNISQAIVRSHHFPLAPIYEQEHIVAKIEELFTQLEAGVTALKRVQAALKRYKASVLKSACEGKFSESRGVGSSEEGLPVGWRWITIEQLAKKEKNSIKRGPFGSTVKKAYFVPKGYKIFEQQNVIHNNFRLGSYYIDEERFELLKDFQIFTGDLLITGAGTIGKLAIVPDGIEPGIINQALLKLSLNRDLVDIQFFIHWFETRLRDYLIAQSRGSAMQNISSVKDLKKMEFALPPLYEQQHIVAEVERRLSVSQQVEAVVAASMARAGRLRQVVLKSAFEGRLT
jgi:type I restriction enzyme S subunit